MENLNEKQREAVMHTEGPLLIIAGPGSGKTRTLVERVSYILNTKDVEAKNIFVATFSRKASKELITRISNKIDPNINLSEMYLGTVHSICHRIIDENLDKSVLNRNYRIFDESEQLFFIYQNMKEFKKLDGYEDFFSKVKKRGSWEKAMELRNQINKISEIDINGQKIDKKLKEDINFLNEVNLRYNSLLKENNALDFSNIQFECLRILAENNDVLAKLQDEIKYMMIDEYQDTNSVQEELFLLIAGKRKNICVVGDDDQAIYRFRGATIRNILEFEKNFSKGECKKIELNRNYRSNKDIVNFCNYWNGCLKWDNYRYKKDVISEKDRINKTKGVIKISETGRDEWKKKLKDVILYLKETGKIEDFNQIAFIFKSVNVRWNYDVFDLMEYFEKHNIPVYSPRSNLFFDREEIRFIIGLFIMVFPQARKIVLENPYKKNGYCMSCFNVAKTIMREDKFLIEHIKKIRETFTCEEKKKYPNFLSIFYSLIGCGSETINKFFDVEENSILKNRSTYNFGILSKLLSEFDDICEIESKGLEDIETILTYFFDTHLKILVENGMSEYEDMREYAPKGAVSFLTIHQSKGLEFPFVIVGSLWSKPTLKKPEYQEKLDDAFMPRYEPKDRIKEFDFWRAFYTAFSRAQNLLALTCIEDQRKPVPSMPFKKIYSGLKDITENIFDVSKLEFEKIKNIEIKENFSFTTHIRLYKDCPTKYKLVQKYKFKQPKNRGAMYGTLVHETLEDINKMIFNEEDFSIEIIGKKYEENYKNLKLNYKLDIEESILEFGRQSVINYYQNYKSIFDEIKDIELSLSYIQEKYILEGVLDLIVEKDGVIEIIDFKTGKRGNQEKTYINQLEIYAYLLSKKYGKKIKKGKLYYIGENEFNKIVEIEFTNERLNKAFNDFDKIAEKILAENYENNYSEESIKCQNCYLKGYCRKKIF